MFVLSHIYSYLSVHASISHAFIFDTIQSKLLTSEQFPQVFELAYLEFNICLPLFYFWALTNVYIGIIQSFTKTLQSPQKISACSFPSCLFLHSPKQLWFCFFFLLYIRFAYCKNSYTWNNIVGIFLCKVSLIA